MDLSKLSGEQLFKYYEQDHPDKDYSSVVSLLPYALMMDQQKAFDALKRIVRENKKLVAVYPGVAGLDPDTSEMEFVGSIIDGGLWIAL